MSTFYVGSVMKVLELLPWSLIWFGKEHNVHVINMSLIWIVRFQTRQIATLEAYYAQLDGLQYWKTHNRQNVTHGRQIDRLKLWADKVDRQQLLDVIPPSLA